MRRNRSAQGRDGVPALTDSVDRIVGEWARERPDLAVSPINVVARLQRLRARFDEELAGLFTRYDLSAADFTVIAALRRAGAPYALPQSVLMNRLGLTSGTVSVRLARLVKKDVVRRSPRPEDARGAVIRLTERGLALFDEVAPAHLANEEVLLSALSAEEQTVLADLLRKLLVGFEHDHSSVQLGMTLAPAHVARRMRLAVGLSDTRGLLATDVAGGSVAHTAGVRAGDLLIAVGAVDLFSCVTLAEAIRDAGPGGTLTLTALRGSEQHTITVVLDRDPAPVTGPAPR